VAAPQRTQTFKRKAGMIEAVVLRPHLEAGGGFASEPGVTARPAGLAYDGPILSSAKTQSMRRLGITIRS
jgi:hypothetical protein